MDNWTTKRTITNRIIALATIATTLLLTSSNIIVARACENTGKSSCLYENYLSAEDKIIYNQIYEAIIDYNEELFYLKHPVSEANLEIIMNALFNDHPELFWANTSYQYAVDSFNVAHKVKLKYGISKDELSNAKANYENAIANIVSGASQYSSDIDKEKYIHDSICSMNTYCASNALNQSAYSALATGSSVCAGYARAFQVVCNKSGIPCYYITGESRGQTHAWNIVYINGSYYNVDLTWDDCIADATGRNDYTYFNKSDLSFSKDHIRSTQSAQLASCY